MDVTHNFFVRRPGIAATASELDDALSRLRACEDVPDPPARWLRSYAVREPDGRFGLACLMQARETDGVRFHAEIVDLPAHEVLRVAGTVVIRGFAPAMVYLVRRRGRWKSRGDLNDVLGGSERIEGEMPREVCWLRSYAVWEDDGTLGTVCIHQAVSIDALRAHSARVPMPADEILPVLGRVVFRE